MVAPSEYVYLDHAATTPLCEQARVAMEPLLASGERARPPSFGNPSGSHALARIATRALDEARERVAAVLGCAPGEVVFTSGGTEADNLAVTGGMPPRPGVPVCGATEHPAVLEPVRALDGVEVAVDAAGRVLPDALAGTLERLGGGTGRRASVVSVMCANNELGTINDLDALAAVVHEHAPGVPLHSDAVQAAPWLDLSVAARAADLVSVSAHKLGGPKGVGALVVRAGSMLSALIHGGGQERGRRGGTPDLAGIVGFAAALEATASQRCSQAARVAALRDELAAELELLGPVSPTVGTTGAAVLPGHLHLLVEGVSAEELLLLLEQRGVCASAGSSCASGAAAGSHVVEAIGVTGRDRAPLRISLGATTTRREIRAAADALRWALARLAERGGSPVLEART